VAVAMAVSPHTVLTLNGEDVAEHATGRGLVLGGGQGCSESVWVIIVSSSSASVVGMLLLSLHPQQGA
jgi:hypothetical protein